MSRTEHRLYVGGTCVSDWRTRVAFMVSGGGEIHGSAFGRLASRGDPCPFPVAQRQIVRFTLDVGGTLHGERLELRLTPMGFEPSVGADDLGGYRSTTIATELSLQVRSDAVDQRLRLRAPDQDRGAFGSVNRIRLRCVTC